MSIDDNAAPVFSAQAADWVQQARVALRALEQHRGHCTIETVLEPLNALWIILDRAGSLAALYRSVHPNAAVRDVATKLEQDIADIGTELELSRPVFEAVQTLDTSTADKATQHTVTRVLRDFRRAGVDRDEPTRARIKQLNNELVEIAQVFERNIRDDVRTLTLGSPEDLAGLPDDYIAHHAPNAGGTIVLTTDYPDYLPFMTYAHSDTVREQFYRLYASRGYPANTEVLTRLLEKRHELAALLGYQDWAAYITEDKMIKTATAVQTFIDQVAQLSAERAERDRAELLARLRKVQPSAAEVAIWQRSYLTDQLKRDRFNFDSRLLRPYFRYPRVRAGIFALTEKLFGITYRPAPDQELDVPRWHDDVEAFDVFDGSTCIGRFYLDMHPRPNKYKHAAAFDIQSGVRGQQIPQAVLVCNFSGGADDPHGLMEHDQVETFLHEFGHLLHHILGGSQRWVEISGIKTEWDFVEAPSQLLEEWAWDAESLKLLAQDDSGANIPDDLLAAMHATRNFGKGLQVRHQMFLAALALHYHQQPAARADLIATSRALQKAYSPFPPVDGTYFHLGFGHLAGYSAMYYTYMWSLMIAKDLLSAFGEQGLLNTDVAGRYRRQVLEAGGAMEAAEIVRGFLGRPYNMAAFESWLAE
jgi:thimet oligopeptidase